MYYFELPEMSLSEAFQANLALIEEITQQYSLENYFGTICTATHEFLNIISKTTKGEHVSLSAGYILENDTFFAHFEISGTLLSLPTLFEEGKEFSSIKIVLMLIDEISYTQDKKGISFAFHVKQETQTHTIQTNKEVSYHKSTK
jgi:hypothetical protein